MKTYRELDTLRPSFFSREVECCQTVMVQHMILICGNCFLVGISYVQETKQLER